MRIAHVTDCYLPRLGGIEMHVRDLAAHQRATGHESEVITATPPGPDQVLDDPWVHRAAGGNVGSVLGPLLAAGRMDRLGGLDSYDVVHSHVSVFSPFALAAARAATHRKLATIVTLHSLLTNLTPMARLGTAMIGLPRWPVIWSAVSNRAADQLRQTLGAGSQVAVLPNGVAASSWLAEPVTKPANRVVLISVMRLAPRKRPMPLLEMLRQLRSRTPDRVKLDAVIVGDGPSRAELEGYLNWHRMADWVTLTGRLDRDRIKELLSTADIYVAPAELESFGIAALEARSAGLPVVASRHGGVGEFIRDGVEGLLTGSDREMMHALTALVASADLRAAMARHNRSVAPSVTWSAVLERTERLYDLASWLAQTQVGASAFGTSSAGATQLEASR